MKTWIGALIPTLVVSAILMAADGRAAEKTSVKGQGAAAEASGPRTSVTTASQTGVPITFLGADGQGNGGLVLNDNSGETRLSLKAGGDGGSLHASNGAGTEMLVIASDGEGGLLSVRNGSGSEAALLGVDSDGGRLRLANNGGTSVMFLGSDTDGEGILWLNNQSGDSVATMGVDADGGYLRVRNHADVEVTFLGSDGEGEGIFWLNGQSGGSVATMGVDADGGFLSLKDHAEEQVVLIAVDSGGAGGFVSISGSRVHDVAEVFDLDTRDGVVPGTVMSIDALGGGGLRPATVPYDRKVVGVISGAGDFRHAMLIGTREDGSHDLPVALSGQVYVRVSAENGPISPGDLLVSSSSAGVAMASTETERSIGAVVGKALQAFAGGDSEGLIRMLVMVR